MKPFLTWLCLLAMIPCAAAIVFAPMSAQERFDQADLVVIAGPLSTRDTAERASIEGLTKGGMSGRPDVAYVGEETDLAIAAVLKGEPSLKKITLHYYRYLSVSESTFALNGSPLFLTFDPSDYSLPSNPRIACSYLFFLVREADGRYASVGSPICSKLNGAVKLDRSFYIPKPETTVSPSR